MKKFLIADFFWQFGDALFLTIASWYILDKLNKSECVSDFYTAATMVGIIITIIYWLMLKGKNPQHIIIGLNITMVVLILISLILIRCAGMSLLVVYLLATCNGIGWNLYFPVSKILLKGIIGVGDVLEGNSLSETAMQVGTLFASLVGSVLYKFVGFEIVLLLVALCYVVSIFMIKAIKTKRVEQYEMETSKAKVNIVCGIYFLCIAMSVPFIASICLNISLSGYVNNILKAEEICYGIMNTIFGMGACLAGVYTMTGFAKKKRKLAIGVCFFMTIVFGGVMCVKANVLFSGIGMFAFGIFGPSIRIFLYTELMKAVTEEMLGMLLSIFNVVSLGIQMFISMIMSINIDSVGENVGFFYYSVVMALGAICFVISTKITKQDGMLEAD